MQPDPGNGPDADPGAGPGRSRVSATQGGPESNDSAQGHPESGGRGADEAEVQEPLRTSPKVIAIHALTIRGLRESIPALIAAFAWLGVSGGLRSIGIVGIIALLAIGLVGLAALNWYRFTYQLANRQLIIAQGILSRRVRTIPVDRIRAIDSQVSPLHRILGLARLKIEAAAGGTGNEEAEIDGLPIATAAALRGDLLQARRRPSRAPADGIGRPGVDADRVSTAGVSTAGVGHDGVGHDGVGHDGVGADGAGEPGVDADRVGAPGADANGPQTADAFTYGDTASHAVSGDAAIEDIEYARSKASWLFYAPLVGSYLAIPLAAVGFLTQYLDDLPESWLSRFETTTNSYTAGQVALVVIAGVVLLALGAVIGAVVLNWRFLLVKRGGLMVSERGLFTRRTVSVEIPRIRGYMLSEGLGMRLARAARLTALITGVSNASNRSQLLPLGPRGEATRVADAAVRRFDVPLRRHPRAAARRRLVRSVPPGLAVLVVGLTLGAGPVIIGGSVLTGLGIVLGIDRYRALGHAYDGASFSLRSGSIVRQTTVLERRAVVGWKVRQSFFQRRAGVSTVTALVGAGLGAYSALDADSADALDLAASNGGRWARELLPTTDKGPATDAAR